MTEPSDPATLRALADEWAAEMHPSAGCTCFGCRLATAIREAAASLETLKKGVEKWGRHALDAEADTNQYRERAEAAEALCATLKADCEAQHARAEKYQRYFHDSDALVQAIQHACVNDEDNTPVEYITGLHKTLAAAEASRDEARRQVAELRQVASRACQTLLATRASQESNG